MKPTRREILAGLAAAALVPACGWEPGPRPDAPWSPEGDPDEALFPTGVQTGDPTEAGAIVGLLTAAPSVRLSWARFTDGGWREDGEVELEARDGSVQHELTGLRADTSYAVVAWSGASRSAAARFRTAAPPGGARVLRFGATSCLGGNLPWPSMSGVAAREIDAFFLLGDTIYNDWGPPTGPRAKWEEALAQRGLRDVSAACALVATWDDHEVRNNWDPERPEHAALAVECLAELRRAIPMRAGPSGGIWRKLSFGDVADVFVLDCRSERFEGRYVSEAQLDWLKQGLAASAARFKLILNSVPITDFSWIPIYGELQADDRWQGHPAQREELLAHIAASGATGVLFVAGDFHVGGLNLIDADDQPGAGIYEVLCGPGGSPVHDMYSLVPESARTPRVIPANNCVLITLRPDEGEIELAWIGDDGEALAREVLTV